MTHESPTGSTFFVSDLNALEQRVLAHHMQVFFKCEDQFGGFPADQMIVFTSKTSPTGRLPAMNTKYGHPYGKQSARKEAA